jgi:hypothetical protein
MYGSNRDGTVVGHGTHRNMHGHTVLYTTVYYQFIWFRIGNRNVRWEPE